MDTDAQTYDDLPTYDELAARVGPTEAIKGPFKRSCYLTLPEDTKEALIEAAQPLWDILEGLGWVDSHGGMQFSRIFPDAIDLINYEANVGKDAPRGLAKSVTDRT